MSKKIIDLSPFIKVNGKSKPRPKLEPEPPSLGVESELKYQLKCSKCDSICFDIHLHTDDKDDIKSFVCADCGNKTVPMVIKMDLMELNLVKQKAQFKVRTMFYRWWFRLSFLTAIIYFLL